MGSVPFAFSIHHFINSVGADAGFAAIIGLAILVLLYFAQARETATLRDHAYEASQRIQQLEGRIAQFTRQTGGIAGQPAPQTGAQAVVGASGQPSGTPAIAAPVAPVPAGVASAGVASAGVAPAGAAAFPAAPAGVGAPALAAATRLIPAAPAPASPSFRPATAAARVPVTAAVAAGLEEPDATTVSPPAPALAPSNGTGQDHVPDNGGGGPGQVQPPPVAAAAAPAPPPPRVQIRPGASAARGPLLIEPQPPRRLLARVLLGLVGLLGIGVIVVILLVVTSSGGGSHSAVATSAPTTNTPAPPHPKQPAPAFQPSSVTVAVLNGTSVANLAHRVAQKLTGAGYKQGSIATAPDQTHSTTIVAFLPGHRNAAQHVAASLKLGPGVVQPIDSTTQAVACPPSTPCASSVIVTVGGDLANI